LGPWAAAAVKEGLAGRNHEAVRAPVYVNARGTSPSQERGVCVCVCVVAPGVV
jgi:hypothetical protein